MNKVLIVGGAGYIGGYLTDILSEHYDVTVYDNLMYENRYFKDVKFIKGDVRDDKKLINIVNDYGTIIWLAAIVGDGACAVNAKLTNDVNEKSVEWVSKNYNGKLIFMSTCSIYGINNNLIDEDASPNPQSEYAKTKVVAENYVTNNSKNYLIFRLGTLFGTGDSFSRPRLDLVVNILTKRAVDGEILNVFGGDQWRPLLHVKDVSTAISFAMSKDISGIYNLSMKNYTISQIASEIKNVIPESILEYKDIPFEDLRNYKVIADKFYNHGWSPKFTLEQGISEIKKIIKEDRIVDPSSNIYSNAMYVRHKYV
jgi:nucleoside-diphosphate-sugar epimerase